MKLVAHVTSGGHIKGLVAMPDGELSSILTPAPGVEVRVIEDHELKGDTVDIDTLAALRREYSVELTPAKAKLIKRPQ